MNHQGLFWNVHHFATIVLRKQINFQSAVIRSKIHSCVFCLLSLSDAVFLDTKFPCLGAKPDDQLN